MTSASPSLAQVTPMAPAASSLRMMPIVFWPLICGRHCNAMLAADRGDAGDIGLHHIEIDQQRRACPAPPWPSRSGRRTSVIRAPCRRARPRRHRSPRRGAASPDCRAHRSRRARRCQAVDEMPDRAVEARLVVAGEVEALLPPAPPEQPQLHALEDGACLAADDLQAIPGAGGEAGRGHGAAHGDGRAGRRLQEDRGESLAADFGQGVGGPGAHDASGPNSQRSTSR